MTEQPEYFVYIKSHCEAPDYEAYYYAKELKDMKCKIKYAEDTDGYGVTCGGQLKRTKSGDLVCMSCGQHYVKENTNS